MTVLSCSSSDTGDIRTSNTDQRHARHMREHARLIKALSLLITARPECELIGVNEAVADLAPCYRIERHDFVAINLRLRGSLITAIGVPTRVWHSPRGKGQILLLKRDLESVRQPSIVIAERIIRRQPRLRNLELLDQAQETVTSPTGYFELMKAVIEQGSVPIVDCAAMLGGSRPVEAVLSLVATGHLAMNLEAPIGPFTLVTMPTALQATGAN